MLFQIFKQEICNHFIAVDTSIVQLLDFFLTRKTIKKFCAWAKSLQAEQLKLQNSVNNKNCLFYYSKISNLEKSTLTSKNFKNQRKKQKLFKSLILLLCLQNHSPNFNSTYILCLAYLKPSYLCGLWFCTNENLFIN